MSQKSYEVFQTIENKAVLLKSYWDNFKTEILQHLPESYHQEVQELSENLEKALETLIDELQHPTLTLATTGTTSSGKSTLVNFLCGAEIVPTAQREMSAGTVVIEYSDEKVLIIEETPGAFWECGTWNNINDEEIYQRLSRLMKEYIKARKKQPDLAYPRSIIRYPFRLASNADAFGLPPGVKVKLLDLPGLSYVEDESNLSIIKQCREALCLVTYNSAETDSYKVDKLLAEVVDQVKDLGGSPARMLFVLNRIDIFRSDYDWQENEREFIEDTTENIKEVLTENLPEHKQEIETLAITKLSSWPALLSLQILANKKLLQNILEELPTLEDNWSDHDRNRLNKILKPYDQTIDNFQSLIKGIMKREKMSVDPKEWSLEQQQLIIHELQKQSYAEDFERQLAQHIDDNFPKLIIPQAIERFNNSAGNSIAQWSVQTTTAILNSSKKDYDDEEKRLLDVKTSLDDFLQDSNNRLRRSLKFFDNLNENKNALSTGNNISDELFNGLRIAVRDLQSEPYEKIKDKLVPLYQWKESISKTIIKILESVAESLDSGTICLDDIEFSKADPIKAKQLRRNLERLIELGYFGENARQGLSFSARTKEKKENLKSIKQGLFDLSANLTSILKPILKRVGTQEKDRIEGAVSELFKFHLKYVELEANEIAENIVVKFPESQLNKFTRALDFSFELDSDINVTSGTYRSWKWLWMKKLDSLNAEIPSTEKLLSNWIAQFKEQGEPDMVCSMLEWLIEQIDDLKKNIAQKSDDAFDSYMASFEKAVQEITANYEEIQNIWQPIQQQAKYLEKSISKLGFFEDVEEKH